MAPKPRRVSNDVFHVDDKLDVIIVESRFQNLDEIQREYKKKNCNRCHRNLMDEPICGARANEKLQSTHTTFIIIQRLLHTYLRYLSYISF